MAHTLSRLLPLLSAALLLLSSPCDAQSDPKTALLDAIHTVNTRPPESGRRAGDLKTLAQAYAEVGNPSKASAFFFKLTQSDRERQILLNHLAEAYRTSGHFDKASKTLRILINQDLDSLRAVDHQITIARIAIASRGLVQASEEIFRAVERHHALKHDPAATAAAKAKTAGDLETLLLSSARTVKLEANKGPAGMIELSIKLVEAHIAHFPHSNNRRDALLLYAEALSRHGQPDAANKARQEALTLPQ